jgi:hypothetical protein
MKITRARAIKGLIGGAAAAAMAPHMALAASVGERMPQPVRDAASPTPNRKEPRFVDGELLLTISTTKNGESTQNGTSAMPTLEMVLPVIIRAIKKLIQSNSQLHQSTWDLEKISGDARMIPAWGVTVRVPLKGDRDVRTAVNVINQPDSLRKISKHATAMLREASPNISYGIQVLSAMPNWYVSSARPIGWAGGPGGLPTPVPGPVTAQFQPPAALSWPQNSPPPNPSVAVAVLDTWPWSGNPPSTSSYQPVQLFLDHWKANGNTYNTYIPANFTYPLSPPPTTYCFADHGLFVAGIIDTIAPHAQLHVMRVLDNNGIGTIHNVLAALDGCIALAQSPSRPVVVNMSLYMLIPPDNLNGGLYWYWQDPNWTPFQTPPHPPMTGVGAQQVLPLHQAVLSRISVLQSYGAVVVAAVGNDGLSYAPNLQPRLPADYDSVLGVVATDRLGKLASYSNCADTPLEVGRPLTSGDFSNGSETVGDSLNCIATWGGQATPQTFPQGTSIFGQTLPQAMRGAVSGNKPVAASGLNDAVVGLCSAPTVNTSGDNTTGWIYWSGTSFATAIISALAANVLALNPNLIPRSFGAKMQQTVTATISQSAEPPTNTGCGYLKVV